MRLGHLGTTTKRMVLIGGLPPQVVVVGVEDQAFVGLELAHLVGAGGDRLARPFDPGLGLHEAALADDLAGPAADAALERDVGHAVDEAHGVLVDRLDLLERREGALGDADTSAGSFLPSMLSRASTVVNRVLLEPLS
jgi:hypothetical protein